MTMPTGTCWAWPWRFQGKSHRERRGRALRKVALDDARQPNTERLTCGRLGAWRLVRRPASRRLSAIQGQTRPELFMGHGYANCSGPSSQADYVKEHAAMATGSSGSHYGELSARACRAGGEDMSKTCSHHGALRAIPGKSGFALMPVKPGQPARQQVHARLRFGTQVKGRCSSAPDAIAAMACASRGTEAADDLSAHSNSRAFSKNCGARNRFLGSSVWPSRYVVEHGLTLSTCRPPAARQPVSISRFFPWRLRQIVRLSERTIGRRIFFVVNRRVIVDEAHGRSREIARRLHKASPGSVLCAVSCQDLAGKRSPGEYSSPRPHRARFLF